MSEGAGKMAKPRSPAYLSGATRAKAGFTLLEVLIVLSIIALIAALVGPRLFGQFDRSKVTAAAVQVKSLKSALDTMQLDIGRYPTEQEGLTLLVQAGGDGAANWSGPYLSGALPKDPWGHDYLYVVASTTSDEPKVCTYGADGKPGGSANAADICS
jgi:general secretion pathway protein G